MKRVAATLRRDKRGRGRGMGGKEKRRIDPARKKSLDLQRATKNDGIFDAAESLIPPLLFLMKNTSGLSLSLSLDPR